MAPQETQAGQPPAFPKIRDVPMEQPLQWLKRGWHDLISCPTASLFYGLCFIAGGALMAAKWAYGKKPGLYSMRDVLNLND